ncbi:metal ABC transporter substrate-binding protein [Natronobacterium gregoryi]|uniref:ABC-type metal ion transport system, periplasmic component/surface adhesin n=2 Tax=Natronobacterium gregoryi TaxID=44930 RepID=L0AD54_NATGS|nr:metal ABC transporter substrate-binding protein [Natronobacterium gregoryi]AFZ71359.1 ABC-type metal ion transport system, periplasmic component/surface adhesin [Natronobacterium gregoryi SP2]ELY67014.1 zinc/manganese/metal ions ABC transporter periplasmic substrate-binding protein 2 [Natronobacterium gregoryi SP2]PLK21260.1 zinc ABC transporter substrate-binding protein [Natronobacterium gregoryi SP2]SFI85451.1 zinc transport system substrate-binding protein [Natronobacterium gregoryi]
MKSDESGSRVVSRRSFTALTGGALTAGVAGCLGDDPQEDEDGNGDAEYTIFASMPAVWDFVRQVAGEHMEAIDLVPVGEHGHDWTPEPGMVEELDIAAGFVYLRDFAAWQDDAADQLAERDDVVVIEATEGIEFFDSPAEDDDEHFWMDPIACQEGVLNVADGLAEIDPNNADDYEANAEAFNDELEQLNDDIHDIVDRAELEDIVLATHDSFQWWNRRYGINIHSPIGTSPDDAASAADVEEVEELVEDLGIEHVCYDVGEPAPLAESLATEVGAEILPLSPIETQIDGSPEVDPTVEMEPDWGYVEHFREINLPTLETALEAE